MNIEERIARSETRQFKVIIPGVLNAHNTLFGGIAMQWMDEVAYITATRFTRQKVVTVSSDKINFRHAVPYGNYCRNSWNSNSGRFSENRCKG